MNGNETIHPGRSVKSLFSEATHSSAAAADIQSGPAEVDDRNPAPGSVDRNCAHDRIRWAILERITDGTYQPGERLKELTLAHEFHVSQAPVREALRKLEAIGVVQSEPYRGARVRQLSPSELRDAYQLRGILEQAATEFITDFPEERIQYLEQEYAAMGAAVRCGDLQALACHNRNFHRCIIERSRNKEVVRAWKSLGISMRSRLNVQRLIEQLPDAILTHQPIIDAMRAGDFRHAGMLLREHSFGFVADLS